MDTELIALRSARIEHEAKIDYQTERINSLEIENETYIRSNSNLEKKLIESLDTIEQRNL